MRMRDFDRWHIAVFFGFAIPLGFALYLQIERVCSISNDLDSRYCTAGQAWEWVKNGSPSVWGYALSLIVIALMIGFWREEPKRKTPERSNQE